MLNGRQNIHAKETQAARQAKWKLRQQGYCFNVHSCYMTSCVPPCFMMGTADPLMSLMKPKFMALFQLKKEDCTNHVQKRMGTALRNLVQKHKSDEHGQRISGKGWLTRDLITKIFSYYRWARKSFAGNINKLHDAVWATFYHIAVISDHITVQ